MDLVAPIPRGLSVTAASILLLLCLLTQLSHMDHLFVAPTSPAAVAQDGHEGHQHGAPDESASETADHSLHCHGGLATCSELPLAAGPGQIIFGNEFLLPASMSSFNLGQLSDADAPREASLSPRLPPPKTV